MLSVPATTLVFSTFSRTRSSMAGSFESTTDDHVCSFRINWVDSRLGAWRSSRFESKWVRNAKGERRAIRHIQAAGSSSRPAPGELNGPHPNPPPEHRGRGSGSEDGNSNF